MISTRDLSQLPGIEELKRLTQSLAMLDAIIEREWDYRYYSFNCKWAVGEQMASMRNGPGDEWFCGFGAAGALLKGFDHKSVMSPWARQPMTIWPGVVDDVPAAFASFLREPAFSIEDTTFCLWRGKDDTAWQRGLIDFPPGDDPDGSAYLLQNLDGRPESYQEWSKDYYERAIDLSAVRWIYEHKPLNGDVMRALNAEINLSDLLEDAEMIGYPLQHLSP
jgi:hypothetical protein